MRRTSLWVFMFMFVVISCKQKKTNEHGHEHEAGGLEPLAYTLYSNKTELFVEFKPLIIGNTSKFATHLTSLGNTFKPLLKGKVTVSLVVGNQGIKTTTESVSSPGIFRLALKPIMIGKGQLIFDIVTDNYTDKIVINDVTVYPDQQTALKNQVQEGTTNEVSYLKEQAWKVPFANELVIRKDYTKIIKTSGMVVNAPGDEIVVSAKSDGIVKFINKNLVVGTPITAGTAMFAIEGGGITQNNIDANYQQALANYNHRKANYERAKELIVGQNIPQKDYLDAKLNYENALINYNIISKNYSSSTGQSNGATMSGFITEISISEGQYVTIGTPLATISKNQKLLLQAHISQKYFDLLPVINSANFKIVGKDEVYDTQSFNGRVISHGKNAKMGASFVPLLFEIDNKINIIPGSTIEFFLKSTPIPNAIVIPVTALVEEQGNFFVYVQTGGESFEKRGVKISTSDGQNVQVLEGLEEGERVVTLGAYQIKLSTASGTMPAHGHEH
jgi:membrane fusion protein, heavy metal efflux system